MQQFPLVAIAILCVAGLFALNGMHFLAMVLFPLPVALYWVHRHPPAVAVLSGLALLVAWLGAASLAEVGAYFVMVMLGILLGTMALRGYAIGLKVSVATLVIFGLTVGSVALNWEESRHSADIFLNARIADAQTMVEGDNAAGEQAIVVFEWIGENWNAVIFGFLFGLVLFLSTTLVVLFERAMRLKRPKGVTPGSFIQLRTSDWFVWLAILLAVLWLIEYRWPQETLKGVTWNGAIALTFVYCLNGFAILLYAFKAFAVAPFLTFAILFGVFYLQLHPVLAAFGFFDTWYDFRLRMDRYIEQRRIRGESDGSDR